MMFCKTEKIYIKSVLFCVCFCLSSAVFANEPIPTQKTIEDLINMNKILEQRLLKLEQTTEIHKKSSVIKVSEPDTGGELSMAFHGYMKADLIYDIGAKIGDRVNYGAIPLNGTTADDIDGHYRMHARESRINFQTKMNTKYGQFKTFIEGDFYGGGTSSPAGSEVISNSVNFRLRHAYAVLGPWLFGQTWSNYVDVASYPENLDFSNDTGQVLLRQSQLRYTMPYKGFTYSFSLENPEADFIDTAGDKRTNGQDSMPDITARILYKRSWGHVSLQSVYRNLTVNDGTFKDSTNGFGLGISGKIKIFNRDQLRFHLTTGDGIGRYIQEAANTAAVVSGTGTNNLSIDSQKASGGYIGYQHWWTENVRSNFNLGYLNVDWNEPLLIQSVSDKQNKYIKSYHANIIWRLLPQVDLGIEISKAEREQVNGAKGDINRLQMSAKYKF